MSNPRFAIVNTCDAPSRRLVAEWKDGVGYCYMARALYPELKRFDGMNPSRPTSVEDFGFTVEVGAHEVEFIRSGPSTATYEDGKPRQWQDRPWAESFTLPRLGVIRKRKKATGD